MSRLQLPNCSHVFHKRCIDKWRLKQNNCPQCREKISENSYKVSLRIEPVGVHSEMVLESIEHLTHLFGIEDMDLNTFITDIEFNTDNYDDVRNILLEIGFPVTTLPERTQ